MRPAAAAIFIIGLAFVVSLLIAGDRAIGTFDVVIVALIVGVAWLGWSAMRRFEKIEPSRCPHCDGLVSAGDSVCKHCGEAIS